MSALTLARPQRGRRGDDKDGGRAPSNAPQWYANIRSVEWQTAPPVAVGSRMAFVAQFLGRRLAYTYEVVELDGGRLVMRTAKTVRSRWRRPTPGTPSRPGGPG